MNTASAMHQWRPPAESHRVMYLLAEPVEDAIVEHVISQIPEESLHERIRKMWGSDYAVDYQYLVM